MLDTILRYFEGSSSLGRSLHDYFAVRSGEQRVFVEGVHGGDWHSPAGEAWYLKVPEDGRIFHRPNLLCQTNGNEKLLEYFVDFVLQQEGGFEKGFDQLFDKYRPFRD